MKELNDGAAPLAQERNARLTRREAIKSAAGAAGRKRSSDHGIDNNRNFRAQH